MASAIGDAFGREAANQAASSTRAAASDAYALVTQSRLAINGLALAAVGFFGIFGVATLHLQSAIISVYVLLFGITLVCFGTGWNSATLKLYFGFMYQPGGQLLFLLIAGNLAWSMGLLGMVVAAFTNATALATWYANGGAAGAGLPNVPVALPAWLGGDGGGIVRSTSATGMVDVRRDELL